MAATHSTRYAPDMSQPTLRELIAESRTLCEEVERRCLALADSMEQVRLKCIDAQFDRERLARQWPSASNRPSESTLRAWRAARDSSRRDRTQVAAEPRHSDR